MDMSPFTALDCKAPEEISSRSTVDYSFLPVVGCPAYAHVNERKLESRAKKCIFLGYQDGAKEHIDRGTLKNKNS